MERSHLQDAVLLPLAALLALGWLGTREVNRRRREAALD
jgi:hypothetical protein